MAHESPRRHPGTVTPAKTRKAACGIRYEEDELREAIDFSGARQWLQESTSREQHDSKETPSREH